MIDERHEELASLYAFDLLEGEDLLRFEAELARNPALQSLVRDLRHASSSLAHTAPSVPPPDALKQRILASIGEKPAAAAPAANVIRPPFSAWNVLPWAAAACFALGAAWLGQRYAASRLEVTRLRAQNEIVEISVQTAQQQLEAERILYRRQLDESQQQLGDATTQLGDVRTQLADRDRTLADLRNQLADRTRQLADKDRQLADSRLQLAKSGEEIRTLTQRVDALAGASVEIGRQLGDAKQQVARLTNELKSQSDLADLKITALTSMLKNSPKAVAVAVWDPKKQEGVLSVENLPALSANEDYQLWIVDPQYPNPVDGGVFTVEPASGARRVQFKSDKPVRAVNAFAVTRERKGGVPKAEGPFIVVGK